MYTSTAMYTCCTIAMLLKLLSIFLLHDFLLSSLSNNSVYMQRVKLIQAIQNCPKANTLYSYILGMVHFMNRHVPFLLFPRCKLRLVVATKI